MNMTLYTEVSLTKDIPEEDLKEGDVATLIDIVPHPTGGEDGVILELFNAVGESIAVVALPLSANAPVRADQMLAVRPLKEAVA